MAVIENDYAAYIQTPQGEYPLRDIGAVRTDQGSSNSGKFLGIGPDGNVSPMDPPKGATVEQAAQIEQNKENINLLSDDFENYVVEQVKIVPKELRYGGYDKRGIFYEDSNYWTSEKIFLDGIAQGSKIKIKASLSSPNRCVVLIDERNNVIDYISSVNAEERGYEVTSQIREIEIEAKKGVVYIATVIRSAFFQSLEDMAVIYKKASYKLAKDSVESENIKENSITSKKMSKNAAAENISVVGKNKIDETESVNGYIETANGIISTELDTYLTSEFLDISKFTKKVCISPRIRYALQFTKDYVPIKESYIDVVKLNAIIDKSPEAYFIRVSYYKEDLNRMQVEDSDNVTEFEEFERTICEPINALNEKTRKKIEELIPSKKSCSKLYGKKWVHFGDSFSEYTNKNFETGDFIGKSMSFPFLISERTGIELDERFFRSGRTMAYPADGTFQNSATCPNNDGYYENIPEDVDYITIMLGINDLNHKTGSGTTPDGEDATGVITIGTIEDTGTDTYYGAYNTVLSWIRENRPFAHVGIFITNGTQNEEFTNAQIKLAEKWGYPYKNLNGDQNTPAMIRCYNQNLSSELKELIMKKQAVDYDGSITGEKNTHPNYKTHEYESYFIESWLETI